NRIQRPPRWTDGRVALAVGPLLKPAEHVRLVRDVGLTTGATAARRRVRLSRLFLVVEEVDQRTSLAFRQLRKGGHAPARSVDEQLVQRIRCPPLAKIDEVWQ